MKWRKRCLALILGLSLLMTGPVKAEDLPGGGGEKYVALTFDDGPTAGVTERLLDGLRERYVSATFFLCGYRIDRCPELLQRMADEGHELGVHGQTHQYLHTCTAETVRRELTETMDQIEALSGVRPTLFRPPGGLTGGTVKPTAEELGLGIILWSVDPEDWACHDSKTVAQRIVNAVRDGDILLLHDLSDSSVEAALSVIDQLERQGYRFCTVSELAFLRGTVPQAGAVYGRFAP